MVSRTNRKGKAMNTEQRSIGGSFTRTDYLLLAHGQAHMVMDAACYWGQGSGEAIEIVIRMEASDEQLQAIHERFGGPLEEMRAFRQARAH